MKTVNKWINSKWFAFVIGVLNVVLIVYIANFNSALNRTVKEQDKQMIEIQMTLNEMK